MDSQSRLEQCKYR